LPPLDIGCCAPHPRYVDRKLGVNPNTALPLALPLPPLLALLT